MGNKCEPCQASTEIVRRDRMMRDEQVNENKLYNSGVFVPPLPHDGNYPSTSRLYQSQNQQSSRNDIVTSFKGQQQNAEKLQLISVELANGLIYKGYMKDNVPKKEGNFVWNNGTTVKCNFQKKGINSKIKLNSHGGVEFEGAIKNYKANGKGQMKFPDGSSYNGEWKNDKPHGYGIYKMENGYCYQGNFKEGTKNGRGTFKFDGNVYQGQFQNDVFNGNGVLIQQNGRIYKGKWVGGMLEGNVQIDYENQDRYVGNYLQNMKHGRGTYYHADGRKWHGEWFKGKKHQQLEEKSSQILDI